MSVLGHYNNFFFAAHLLDIAMGVKTLRTILSSVTHNGKQVPAHLSAHTPTDMDLIHGMNGSVPKASTMFLTGIECTFFEEYSPECQVRVRYCVIY